MEGWYEGYSDLEENIERADAAEISTSNVRIKPNILDDLSDKVIIKRFRFSKEIIYELLTLIECRIQRINNRRTNVSPVVQLLVTLRFYASGSFQMDYADLHLMSQSAVSKIVKTVSHSIASLRSTFITYPTVEAGHRHRKQFYEWSRFPGIVGAIDCIQIRIKSPGGENAQLYRNRKGFFALNVQAVYDCDGKFINLVARWPGSTHDSRIFDNSHLKAKLIEHEAPGILVGDSGYACKRYLLTPFLHSTTAEEKRYNEAQIRARNPIERAFGTLKRRFHCLGSELRTKISTSLAVITACFVLHNLAKIHNELEPDSEGEEEDEYEVDVMPPTPSGSAYRKLIVENYFT